MRRAGAAAQAWRHRVDRSAVIAPRRAAPCEAARRSPPAGQRPSRRRTRRSTPRTDQAGWKPAPAHRDGEPRRRPLRGATPARWRATSSAIRRVPSRCAAAPRRTVQTLPTRRSGAKGRSGRPRIVTLGEQRRTEPRRAEQPVHDAGLRDFEDHDVAEGELVGRNVPYAQQVTLTQRRRHAAALEAQPHLAACFHDGVVQMQRRRSPPVGCGHAAPQRAASRRRAARAAARRCRRPTSRAPRRTRLPTGHAGAPASLRASGPSRSPLRHPRARPAFWSPGSPDSTRVPTSTTARDWV